MQLLIIADDFTGALDVSVQFAPYDVKLKVVTGSAIAEELLAQEGVDILVVDTETRHLPPQTAADAVDALVRMAKKHSVPHVYVKVDSGLRGNVGVTLSSVLQASGENFLAFAPAFPEMRRVTEGGVQFWDGTPIHQSAFREDPFDPVQDANITDLFRGCPVDTRLYARNATYDTAVTAPTVGIFDVCENGDFTRIADHLQSSGQMRLLAGCAAFAAVYPAAFHLPERAAEEPLPSHALLVLCGSLNAMARKQLAFAESQGFEKITLTRRQQAEPSLLTTGEGEALLDRLADALNGERNVILETSAIGDRASAKLWPADRESKQKVSDAIATRMGEVQCALLQRGCLNGYTTMVVGGDTLLGVMRQLGYPEITVRREIEPGIVLFTIEHQGRVNWMISKAGSFGDFELLHRMTARPIG